MGILPLIGLGMAIILLQPIECPILEQIEQFQKYKIKIIIIFSFHKSF